MAFDPSSTFLSRDHTKSVSPCMSPKTRQRLALLSPPAHRMSTFSNVVGGSNPFSPPGPWRGEPFLARGWTVPGQASGPNLFNIPRGRQSVVSAADLPLQLGLGKPRMQRGQAGDGHG